MDNLRRSTKCPALAAYGTSLVRNHRRNTARKQCFKFAKLTFAPFGKEIVNDGGTASTVANIFWIILTGVPMAIDNFVFGAVLCCTIIGIPFGKQYFKIARLALAPFGVKIK